jgi:hypothetical protein
MSFSYNPFSGNFDTTPSTQKAKSVYTLVNANSADWESVYTNVNENSATYAKIDFVQNNFLPLSGGDLTGKLGVTNRLSLTGRDSVSMNGLILYEPDLTEVINENLFLKIIINNENKLIRL